MITFFLVVSDVMAIDKFQFRVRRWRDSGFHRRLPREPHAWE
jgi:hypothetical protein